MSPMNGNPQNGKAMGNLAPNLDPAKPNAATTEMLELLAKDFALHCRTLRQNLGMNQTSFGQEMGIRNRQAKITVSRWESGSHVPQKRYLLKFLEISQRFDKRKKVS